MKQKPEAGDRRDASPTPSGRRAGGRRSTEQPVRLIALTGGSGSGKSWLARRLQRRLGALAGILSLDDFYRDLSGLTLRQRAQVNFDHPDAIEWNLFHDCLERLQRGEAVRLPRYDFATHTRRARPRIWRPKPIVLLDGLWLLHRPELRGLYDLSLFCQCPAELRLARRLDRDQRERGRSRASVLRQFRTHVGPMHDQFVEPQARYANLLTGPEITRELLAKIEAAVRHSTRV
jgi:uridine kinase